VLGFFIASLLSVPQACLSVIPEKSGYLPLDNEEAGGLTAMRYLAQADLPVLG
jgi:hypothetical protein